MPYQYPEKIPDVAKNWTPIEQRACIAAANAALERGGNNAEQSAIFACIHAAGRGRDDAFLPKPVPRLIAQMKAKAKAQGRKFKLRRIPIPASIKPLQRAYLTDLMPIMRTMKDAVDSFVVIDLRKLMKEFDFQRPSSDAAGAVRSDAFLEELDRILDMAKLQFYQRVSDTDYAALSKKNAEKVNKYNNVQFNRQFASVLNIELTRIEPWITDEIKVFVRNNVSLIKSVPQQYFEKVEQAVLRGAQGGTSIEGITEELQKNYDMAENRAALIARDQISKFNGNLNMLRQKSVGVEKYVWSTSLDERVRPEHADREGDVFSWDNPPEDGHPGQAVNCRCAAIPVFDDSQVK